MRRRDFIALVGGASVAWPLKANAQQPAMPVIGFLNGGSAIGYASEVDAFHQGLKKAGYIEGQNVVIEYRWANDQYDSLLALANDLVRIVANTPANLVAKAATSTISAGLVINTGTFFTNHSEQLAAVALRYSVPTIFQFRRFVAAGGLASYSGSTTENYRLAGDYAGRILKGEKPANLPVQQSTKIELFINLKTAKAFGITVPKTLLVAADEIIE